MSLRYSIYKVQTSSFRSFLSAANFYILAHLVELVKNFFQVFSNSFLCSLCSRRSRSSHNLIILPYSLRFVKTFFLVFRSSLIHLGCLVDSFDILTQVIRIVKILFLVFSNPCECHVSDWHILPRLPPFVKHFLQLFSTYFGVFNRCTLFVFL